MSNSNILLHSDGPLATITLNRPEKLNALTPDMLAALDTTLAQIEQQHDLRVVILTGAGERAFCVGADIHAWGALEPLDMWRHWIPFGHRVMDRLARLRLPTIAALNGFALGGGLELALAADIRLAAASAELGLPEVSIGIVPGWGGTERLPRIIGAGRAKQMIFSGARVDARTAEDWGLVNEVVAAETLMQRAQELAGEIARRAPLAVQFAKQAIDGGAGYAASATLEALAGALAAGSEDGREGVASFREKRAPQFRGR
ncbi:MAG TPA: enoyl-CoA hydratase-related protein [Spirillospora sp.]|nr:enoyl-CoA hydratase-related protein [Spirillospora sp.]